MFVIRIELPRRFVDLMLQNKGNGHPWKNMRTDSADPTTQDTIYPGSIESVEAAPWANSQPLGNIRFLNGSTVCYLQMSQGTGEAVITGLV